MPEDKSLKFKELLRKLFMFDNADLDFGIYRIMNAKRGEIERFLDKDLIPQVRQTLSELNSYGRVELEKDLDAASKAAIAAGISPEQSPKVRELKERMNSSCGDLDSLESEVFSRLYDFFNRYYKDGDFISLRRYKEGVYAIPYEGEEVVLHWANKDQYYIKTSEFFRDYSFKLSSDGIVHFKIVEADTEKDNVKTEKGKERRFSLAESDPVAEENGELVIRFEYLPNAENQKKLNEAAEKAILAEAPAKWRDLLAVTAPNEKDTKRTLLKKHLDEYTNRNSFDYFIHKDLGSFLRRELDFFIKNEIMLLDDIENEKAPRVEQYLAKIKAMRRISHKIIDFLAQLEDFQKKLWLKKKFVVETNYCATLDRVPKKLWPEVAGNLKQWQEWQKLGFVEAKVNGNIPLDNLPAKPADITVKFLPETSEFIIDLKKGPSKIDGVPVQDVSRQEGNGADGTLLLDGTTSLEKLFSEHQFLIIDTALYDSQFTDELLKSIDNFDEQCDGLLVHSENFQALNLLHAKYRKQVKCIYIDPPYNLGPRDFAYKDNYQSSSWAACIAESTAVSYGFLHADGCFFFSIGLGELGHSRLLLDSVFPTETHVGTFTWKARVKPVNVGEAKERPQQESEFVLGYEVQKGKGNFSKVASGSERTYSREVDGRKYRLTTILKSNRGSSRRDTMRFEIAGYTPPEDQRWQGGESFIQNLYDTGHLEFTDETPMRRYFEDEEDAEHDPFYCYIDTELSSTSEAGKTLLNSILGNRHGFDTVKPIELVRYLLEAGAKPGSLVLDYFAGSGTTGHATIDLNRKDGGKRKYILVEMGNYFDTVLKPRIEKVVYAKDWKDGKPEAANTGISHCFKYIKLESYEDALNNLELVKTSTQDDLLSKESALREDYMLHYMLEVESRDSLLNLSCFENPFDCKLKIGTGSVGETKDTVIDLVETFNYLLGLRVKHIDTVRGFKAVQGKNPDGEKVLVIWRNVREKSNKALDEFFLKQGYNTRDMEFDLIYVNGDNNLENLKRPDETWKVRLIEEDFLRLMWETRDA